MKKTHFISTLSLLLVCSCSVNKSSDTSGGSASGNGVSTLAGERPAGAAVATAHLTAEIVDIDYVKRHVTLRSPEGRVAKLAVGPEARNFNQAKVGDRVDVDYTEALVMDVSPDDGQSNAVGVQRSFERAALGEKPRGVVSNTVSLKATVEAIDYAKRVITVVGPEGNSVTMKVGPEAKRFAEIRKGDAVRVVYQEALAISVTTPGS